MCQYENERSQYTIDALKLILKLDPKNIYYASNLRNAYSQLGQYSEAIEFFKQYALTLKVQDQDEKIIKEQLENLMRIGTLLSQTNQFDEAFQYLQQAIELDQSPTKQETFFYSATMLYDNNCYENCIKLCDQYQKYSPQVSYFYKAQNSIRLNRIQEAIHFLELRQQIKSDYDIQDQIEGLKIRLLEEKQQNEKPE